MRSREEIIKSLTPNLFSDKYKETNEATLEVLLDIRDLLTKRK